MGAGIAAPAQSSPAPSAPQFGTIGGMVVDKDGAVVTNADITLSRNGSLIAQLRSGGDGSFSFTGVAPGPFQVSIAAPGFAPQLFTGVLQPGQSFAVPQIQLVVATITDVEVRVSQEEVAEEQIKAAEQQRLFGVVPNYYVSYIPDAAPLTRKQKFQLGWKSTVDPVSFGIAGVIAGIEQADNAFSGYGQGAQGYAKRFGSTYADFVSGTFIGSAILPSLLKQDPRYFYKGTGTKKSRFLYAVANAVICKGDNGRWQPNYSSMLGGLAAGGLSNLYYPASNRNGVGLTFENGAIGIGGTAIGGVIQEFFFKKVTPHSSGTEQ